MQELSDATILDQFNPVDHGSSAGLDAFLVAFYAIISMIVLVGIAHLIGMVMRNQKIKDWAKDEFMQVIISAALVGGIFILFNPTDGTLISAFNSLVDEVSENNGIIVMDESGEGGFGTIGYGPESVVCDGAGLPKPSIMCFAFSYLSTLFTSVINLIFTLFLINFILEFVSKVAIDIVVVEFAPLSGLSSLISVISLMIQTLMFLEIALGVQMALLKFINSVAMTIFLPIGVVLRSFFATRRIGGALMAIALGLYVVFPLTISLSAISVDQVNEEAFNIIQEAVEAAEGLNPANVLGSEEGPLSVDAWSEYIGTLGESVSSLAETIMKIPGALFGIVSSLIVQIIFLPFLSVMLTVLSIKELAKLLGGEISLGKFEV